MSTEAKWTPEPWHRDGMHINVGQSGRIGTAYETVAGVAANDNADRIVACVNALSGIPDPAAFVARAREIERAATCYANVPPQLKGEAFRDLLNALSLPGGAGGGA